MTTDKGVWNLQQVRDKQLQSLWTYTGSATEGAQLWVWGLGPVGNNTAPSYSSPVQIPGDWKKYYNSFIKFGIKEGDTLWAWGDNTYGTLGQNNRTVYSSPIQIPGTWSAVMVGNDKDWYKSGAITTDGELFCWGQQNGANIVKFLDDVNYSSPVQIPGTTWKQGSWDRLAAYWTKTDGTMYALGSNMYGQLGNNGPTGGPSWSPSSRSSPVQIPGTSWSHVSGSLALRTDGSLWTWGANEFGQLGLNAPYNGGHRSSPVQIPGSWSEIAHGSYTRAAINTDGELFTWGYNLRGQLGINESGIWRSSPTQVGSDTTWEAVAMFGQQSRGIKTDGTLWAWGWNGNGDLGQNTNIQNYSSPVQIPGTWLSNRLETSYGGAIRF